MSAPAKNADLDSVVALARAPRDDYGMLPDARPAPELPGGAARTVSQAALRDLFLVWGLDREHAGSPQWNPLGQWIRPGMSVTLKPNFVLHYNQSGRGLECLITHPSVIQAVLEYVALARPGRVIVGDAPVQGCDFAALRQTCGLDALVEQFRVRGMDLSLCDFRRTISLGGRPGDRQQQDCRGLENYILFDLKDNSLLEAFAGETHHFRVTMYDPDLLQRTHSAGRHQYLVAREVMEADVLLNLPKLKCHKKSCITGALKNLIGINGNKEYLPHHRKGGSGSGGDCYAGASWLKARAEDLLDTANRGSSGGLQAWLMRSAEWLARGAGDPNLEGSWYGNATIWRTCLDLQRILHYGRLDGSMAGMPQRAVVTITDAIIAGEGEGPLANTPVPTALLTGSASTAAAEWVHARLMGFDPEEIPLIREAFGQFRFPLAGFCPDAIRVLTASGEMPVSAVEPAGRPFVPPLGWRGHCELATATRGSMRPAELRMATKRHQR